MTPTEKARRDFADEVRRLADHTPHPFLCEDGWRNPYSGDPLSPVPTYWTKPPLGIRMYVRQIWTVPELEAAEAATRERIRRDERAHRKLAERLIAASADYSHYIPPTHPRPIPVHPYADTPQFKQAHEAWSAVTGDGQRKVLMTGENDLTHSREHDTCHSEDRRLLTEVYGDQADFGDGITVNEHPATLMPALTVQKLQDYTGYPIDDLRAAVQRKGGPIPKAAKVKRDAIVRALPTLLWVDGIEEAAVSEVLGVTDRTVRRWISNCPLSGVNGESTLL